MTITKSQRLYRKEFAHTQFEHCLKLIKSVIHSKTNCICLNTKYYKIYMLIDSYSIEDGGCGKCKEKYSSIYISGLVYGLVDEHPYTNAILKYGCYISQHFVLCVCDEEENDFITVEFNFGEEEDEVTQSYDLLFKFDAEHFFCPQFVPSRDEIQVAKWPLAPTSGCFM
jgi:hypothetical protein